MNYKQLDQAYFEHFRALYIPMRRCLKLANAPAMMVSQHPRLRAKMKNLRPRGPAYARLYRIEAAYNRRLSNE